MKAAVETQLMQNYRQTLAVDAGSDLIAVRNGRGDVELFAIGAHDSRIWNYCPDPSSSSGYSAVPTGMTAQGQVLAAGTDAAGNVVVFTPQGDQDLRIVIQTPGGPSRWSAPLTVPLPQPEWASPSTGIPRIVAGEAGGQMYLAAFMKIDEAVAQYTLAYGAWDTEVRALQSAPVIVNDAHGVWTGSGPADAALAAGLVSALTRVPVANAEITLTGILNVTPLLGVAAANDATGTTRIFAVLDGGWLVTLAGNPQNTASWVSLSESAVFTRVEAATDTAGDIHLFALTQEGELCHLRSSAATATGFTSPAPIATNAAQLAVAANGAGAIDVFLASPQGALTHLFLEENSTNWGTQPISRPGPAIESYASYQSQLTLCDDTGVPAGHTPVVIRPDDETVLTVNGRTWRASPRRPVTASTNAAGILTIAQEVAGTLTASSLDIAAPSLAAAGESLAIRQSAGVEQTFRTITGAQLLAARTAGGAPLLTGGSATPRSADSLAWALRKFMELAGAPALPAAPFAAHAHPAPGVWLRPAGDTTSLRAAAGAEGSGSWRLHFDDGGGVRYEEVTEEAAAVLAARWRSLQRFGSIEQLWWGAGDLIQDCWEGAVKIGGALVTGNSYVIYLQVKNVVGRSVEAFFEALVQTIDDAFDAVALFFANVGAGFEQVFAWLGHIFAWDDILRTQQAILYTVDQYFDFLEGAVPALRTRIDDRIGLLSSQVTGAFDAAIRQLGGSTLSGTMSGQRPPKEFAAGVANNIVLDALAANAGGATPVNPALASLDTSAFDEVLKQIDSYAATTASRSAFEELQAYFSGLGSDPGAILQNALSGLLKLIEAVVQAALAGFQAVVDALLTVAVQALRVLRTLLEEVWNIPFVTDLYAFVTDGAPFSLLNVMALAIAIPATVIFKAVKSVAPFPDDASLRQFRASFDARTLLGTSGLVPVAGVPVGGPGPLTRTPFARLFHYIGATATLGLGLFSGLLDAQPRSEVASAPGLTLMLSGTVLGLRIFESCFTAPWWEEPVQLNCTTPAGMAQWFWMMGVGRISINAVSLLVKKTMTENSGTAGALVTATYGTIYFMQGCAGAAMSGQLLTWLHNTIPTSLQILKILRLSSSPKVLLFLGACDGLFHTASAAVSFSSASGNASMEPMSG